MITIPDVWVFTKDKRRICIKSRQPSVPEEKEKDKGHVNIILILPGEMCVASCRDTH